MEEHVGRLWHRGITRLAGTEHPHAAVALDEVRNACGLWFRAFGGDPGLAVEATADALHGARRRWLQRIAGVGRHAALAYCDTRALKLPARIALFADAALNRSLYLWLSALCASPPGSERDWFRASQQRSRDVLERFPGLRAHYHRLLAAHLASRPDPARLPAAEARVERAVRAALEQPGSIEQLPPSRRPPAPVPLWLHPAPPTTAVVAPSRGGGVAGRKASTRHGARRRRHRVEQISTGTERAPFLLFKADAIFSWAEFVRVNRGTDDDEDPDAARTADAMDRLSIAPDGDTVASRVRLELDIEGGEDGCEPLEGELLLPEWDYRSRRLLSDHCRARVLTPEATGDGEMPAHLRRLARRVRARFEALAPQRVWQRRQSEGSEVDIDACIEHRAAAASGATRSDPRLFRAALPGNRDLACLLLADLSLSTDAWVSDEARVVDVIRDSLLLFGEALAATGDRFAIYGFSSQRRNDVRLHALKPFATRYDTRARARINAIRPGFYTRLGAAVRFASERLAGEAAERRLLLVLTDGKPNDQDHYDGRYGIEDTRMAVNEARRAGLHPFCVTVDERGPDYLPHLFGSSGYVLVRDPAQLPRELPRLYARLTA